jgi:hypothetical protein
MRPELYECGICGYLHLLYLARDCSNTATRYTAERADAVFGSTGWDEVEWRDGMDMEETPDPLHGAPLHGLHPKGAPVMLVAEFLAEMGEEVQALLERALPRLAAEYRARGADIPTMGDAEWAARGALLQCRDALQDESLRMQKEGQRNA